MPMGDSGGRSAGHRTGDGARRRFTERERALVDPPADEIMRQAAPVVWSASWLALMLTALFILALVL